MNNPLLGFNYLLEGFHLITKPGLKRFVIIPLFINILFFVGLFFLLNHYLHIFNDWFVHHLPSWLFWLASVLWVIFLFSFILLFTYTFIILANLIAAPFNSLLAEKVEIFLTGKIPEDRGLLANIKDIPRIMGRQLSIIGYYLPRALLILVLFFVPIIQAFAGALWFLFTAWMVAITYVDYPTDNKRIPIKLVREQLKQKRLLSICFGMGVLLCSMIPLLNLIIIPAAVAGATKLWLEMNDGKN